MVAPLSRSPLSVSGSTAAGAAGASCPVGCGCRGCCGSKPSGSRGIGTAPPADGAGCAGAAYGAPSAYGCAGAPEGPCAGAGGGYADPCGGVNGAPGGGANGVPCAGVPVGWAAGGAAPGAGAGAGAGAGVGAGGLVGNAGTEEPAGAPGSAEPGKPLAPPDVPEAFCVYQAGERSRW